MNCHVKFPRGTRCIIPINTLWHTIRHQDGLFFNVYDEQPGIDLPRNQHRYQYETRNISRSLWAHWETIRSPYLCLCHISFAPPRGEALMRCLSHAPPQFSKVTLQEEVQCMGLRPTMADVLTANLQDAPCLFWSMTIMTYQVSKNKISRITIYSYGAWICKEKADEQPTN